MSIDVEQVVRENITKTVHMSLATVSAGKPWVCEVHFAYDDDLNLYYCSLPTRRHSQEIATNPVVAGNIVKQHELGEAVVGVYFEGTAELLSEPEGQLQAFASMQARLGTKDDMLKDAANPDEHQFYKITVQNWYVFGRFGEPSGQKHQLVWNGGKR